MNDRAQQVLMYGESHVAKNEIFEKEMNAVAEKYKHWFESRPGRNEYIKHDTLEDHYILFYDGRIYKFGKVNGSELPDEIWNECIEASNIAFGS